MKVKSIKGEDPEVDSILVKIGQSSSEAEDNNEFELYILGLEPAAADVSGVHKLPGEGKPSSESRYMENSKCFHE